MDPICEEEADIESREDTEKEKVESCHLHLVLEIQNWRNTDKKNDTAKKQYLTCNLTLVQKSYSDEKQWRTICIKNGKKEFLDMRNALV